MSKLIKSFQFLKYYQILLRDQYYWSLKQVVFSKSEVFCYAQENKYRK